MHTTHIPYIGSDRVEGRDSEDSPAQIILYNIGREYMPALHHAHNGQHAQL